MCNDSCLWADIKEKYPCKNCPTVLNHDRKVIYKYNVYDVDSREIYIESEDVNIVNARLEEEKLKGKNVIRGFKGYYE